MPALRNIALTVQELEVGEFFWVLLEATNHAMEDFLPYLPLETADGSHASYGDALIAGFARLRALYGKDGPRI